MNARARTLGGAPAIAGVTALEAYDSSDSYINVDTNTTEAIVFPVVEKVPEPASPGLFVAGLLGFGFGRRRKR